MTKFVLFTTPRTGSTLLIKTLDSHPEIMCAGEIFFFRGAAFHNEYRYPFIRIPLIGAKLNYVVNYPLIWLKLPGFLNRFYAANTKGERARGFKLMQYQTYYTPGMISYLEREKVKVIVLIRKNTLRNTLSDLRARATGIYHNTGDGTTKNIARFRVNLDELGRKMKEIEGFNQKLEQVSASLDRKIIYYEDFERWDETIAGVEEFLGVTPMPLQAASKKLNPEKLEDMLENYAEVKAWLQANGYAAFAD